MPMYKGKKYEYDEAGLEEYHAAKKKKKKIKRAKDVQMQNLNLSPAEKKEKERLEKLKGPLGK
ncbi:hypothetical protein N9095_00550 [bacterium]|nr:hypothetical protein [bacterium]